MAKMGAPTNKEKLEREQKKLADEKTGFKFQKMQHEIQSLKEELVKTQKIIEELRIENESLKIGGVLFNTEDNKIKKVLELRAKNDDVILIQSKLTHIGLSITIDEVETICNNIDSLNIEFQKYFDDCAKKYEESIEINPKILKRKNLENNQFNIDATKKAMLSTTDAEMLRKLRVDLDKFTLTNAKILESGIVTDKEETADSNNIVVNNMQDDFEKNKNKILNFDLKNIKKI